MTFPCGDLSLEGVCSVPEGKGPFAAVVVCHPHPLYGGMMDNNVVIAVCRAALQTSIASLRLTFAALVEAREGMPTGLVSRMTSPQRFPSSRQWRQLTKPGLGFAVIPLAQVLPLKSPPGMSR